MSTDLEKIKKIAHLSDIHIRKNPSRDDEYRFVFDNLYKSLKEQKPDRIVLSGDLVNEYLDIQPEQLVLAVQFLNQLSKIAPVRIIRGNHDIRKKNLKRKDSVDAIVKVLNDFDVEYLNEIGPHVDDNVVWMVWKHGVQNNNPWRTNKYKSLTLDPEVQHTTIDLFHDPINGAVSDNGKEFKNKNYYKLSHFKGDYSFFGDLHKKQYFSDKTKAYCGSLIAQNIKEGDDNFHGYLLWDIEDGSVEEFPIFNKWTYKTLRLNDFTEFEDPTIEIENPTENMTLRFIWNTLPSVRNKENEILISKYIRSEYPNSKIKIYNENDFVVEDEIEASEDILDIKQISDQAVQHDVFKSYLEKMGFDDNIINEIIKLDDVISSRLSIDEVSNIEWDIVKFWGENFMSYKYLNIDWRDADGLYQINGKNTAGKTTIMKLLTYILYNKTIETEKSKKFGDFRYVNNRIPVDYCNGGLILKANDEYYGIKRSTTIEKKKNGEIKGAPTVVEYFKLDTPDDDLIEAKNINSLNDEDRKQTQKLIDKIVGTYDNFMRNAMTTSDTLNQILSENPADFQDNILFDSGLEIFDVKLKEFKEYQKEENKKQRVSCDLEKTDILIDETINSNKVLNDNISEIENDKLIKKTKQILAGEEYLEGLTKKLHKIDQEIYTLNVPLVKENIATHNETIKSLNESLLVHTKSIKSLKETYDVDELNQLLSEKEKKNQEINNIKFEIKNQEQNINNEKHKIELINGEIYNLKVEGKKKKDEILELRNSKTCITCGQLMTEEHRKHVDIKIKKIMGEAIAIAFQMKKKEDNDIPPHNVEILNITKNNVKLKKDIEDHIFTIEKMLSDIGKLMNDKADVEKRIQIVSEMEKIPLQIENNKLSIKLLNDKISLYDISLRQIEENKQFNKTIILAKQKLDIIRNEETLLKEDIFINKNIVAQNSKKIKDLRDLVKEFKEQEKRDLIMSQYQKCVHREGIPRQLLITIQIPKINLELKDLLKDIAFDVWIEPTDIRPKLVYNQRMDAVIDAISSSGKERTFSAISLKRAMTSINSKSKPNLFLLDEVMGKLDEEAVEEFIELLHKIKSGVSKLLVVEHKYELESDYILDVELNDMDISEVTMR